MIVSGQLECIYNINIAPSCLSLSLLILVVVGFTENRTDIPVPEGSSIDVCVAIFKPETRSDISSTQELSVTIIILESATSDSKFCFVVRLHNIYMTVYLVSNTGIAVVYSGRCIIILQIYRGIYLFHANLLILVVAQ